MTGINDVYGDSKWLKAEDLKGRKIKVRIMEWEITKFKQMDGSERQQVVVGFAGKEKRLGLNKTNGQMVASMYGGEDLDAWIGKEITLYPTKTMNQQGKLVDCIRIEYVPPEPEGFVSGLQQATQVGSTRATAKSALKPMFDERNPPPSERIPPHVKSGKLEDEMNDEVPF